MRAPPPHAREHKITGPGAQPNFPRPKSPTVCVNQNNVLNRRLPTHITNHSGEQSVDQSAISVTPAMSGTSSFRQMVARFWHPTMGGVTSTSRVPDEQHLGVTCHGRTAPVVGDKAVPASAALTAAPAATRLRRDDIESSVWIHATVTGTSESRSTTSCEIKVAGLCESVRLVNVTVINECQRDGLVLQPPPISHHHLVRHLYPLQ